MSFSDDNLIWVDLEMTGLDPETHKIIEIASIVTDSELNILAEGPVIAIHQPESELAKMDDWCTNTHTASGWWLVFKQATTMRRVRSVKLSRFWKSGYQKVSRLFAATVSVKIVVSCINTCQNLKSTSITVTSMSARLKS